jgi:hypothetical protein
VTTHSALPSPRSSDRNRTLTAGQEHQERRSVRCATPNGASATEAVSEPSPSADTLLDSPPTSGLRSGPGPALRSDRGRSACDRGGTHPRSAQLPTGLGAGPRSSAASSSAAGVPATHAIPVVRGSENAVNERRLEAPGNSEKPTPKPVPKDPPDQQATADEDPWDVVGVSAQPATEEVPDLEIPDRTRPAPAGGALRIPAANVRSIPCPTNRPPDAPRAAGAPAGDSGRDARDCCRSPAGREDTSWVYVPGSANGPSTAS